MQFKCIKELIEKVGFPHEVVRTMKQTKKATVLYEKIKVLSESADRMTEDPEQAYILYSRCLYFFDWMMNCDDFTEFSKSDEFEHCSKVVQHSLDESNYLKDYLETIYASIHPVDREDFGKVIRSTQLMDYVKNTGKTVLIIDYRHEKLPDSLLRDNSSIQFLPLDQSLLQKPLNFVQLHHSVGLLYFTAISDIQKFGLVVLMGDKLEGRYSTLTGNLLGALTSYNITHELKRNPLFFEYESKELANDNSVEKDIEQFDSKLASLSVASSDLNPANLDKQQEMAKLSIIYKRAMKLIEESASLGQTLPGHTGLSNLGNTCFMSSALQALFHTPEMHQLFTKKKFIHQVNPKKKPKSAGMISACFSALVDSVWSTRFKYIKPDCFLSLFAKKVNAELTDRRQHDAQEFFSCLLSSLHEETNQVDDKKPFIQNYDGKNIQEDAVRYFEDLKLFESSPIRDLFDLTSVTTLTCMECNTSSVSFENMPLILLEIPVETHGHCPLSACLEHYFRKSVLKNSEKWNCPNCKSLQKSERSMRVWSFPPVLVICLKRFTMKSGELRKNSIDVKFEVESLDMSSYIHESSGSKVEAQYELYAVTNHQGSLHQGHYMSAVHTQEMEWLKFDDESVSRMSSKEVQSQDAYILYFRKTSM